MIRAGRSAGVCTSRSSSCSVDIIELPCVSSIATAPATTGTSKDHRNGLERTKLETSNSQPQIGAYQKDKAERDKAEADKKAAEKAAAGKAKR